MNVHMTDIGFILIVAFLIFLLSVLTWFWLNQIRYGPGWSMKTPEERKKKPISEEMKRLKENTRNCGHCQEMAGVATCAIFRAANEVASMGDYDSWGKLFYCCPLFKQSMDDKGEK